MRYCRAVSVVEGLREARLRRGLSQEEVARRMRTTQSAVARLEAGAADPRLSTLERYATAVGAELYTAPVPRLARTALEVASSLRGAGAGEALHQVIQFLDDVHRLEKRDVGLAVRDEPDSVGDRRWDALLAAVAEYVTGHAGLPVPGWASAPGRFLTRFWFVIEDIVGRPAPALAVAAFTDAPPEFANRGVFLDRSSLVSV